MKTYLPANLYALDFTLEHYKYLLKALKISDNEKLFDLKKGTLIDGLVAYFNQSFQDISVEISFNNCSITKHFLDKTASESLDRMMHKNSKLLIDIAQRRDEYRVLPYLLSIPEDTRELLFKGFLNNNENMDKARTLTRLQIQPILNVEERDIIFFLRGRIWIRYYVPLKKVIDGQDKRYAGESEEALQAMYDRYFPKGMWEDIESILKDVLEEKLNFSSITSETFRRTFIPVFRGMIEILLIDVISPNERDKIEGFTGYVLRKYFDRILLYTAKNLLHYVENRDKNAESFIKSFSDTSLIDSNGNKTKTYAIVDTKQQTWNHVTILSILLQYKQAKLRMVSQNNILVGIKEQLHQSDENLKSELKVQETQEKNIDVLLKQIAESELKSFKNKKASDSSQMKRYEDLLTKKRTEENELYLIKNRIANFMIESKRLKSKLKHETEAKNALMEQTEPLQETYGRIAHALALVLTKR